MQDKTRITNLFPGQGVPLPSRVRFVYSWDRVHNTSKSLVPAGLDNSKLDVNVATERNLEHISFLFALCDESGQVRERVQHLGDYFKIRRVENSESSDRFVVETENLEKLPSYIRCIVVGTQVIGAGMV